MMEPLMKWGIYVRQRCKLNKTSLQSGTLLYTFSHQKTNDEYFARGQVAIVCVHSVSI